MARFAARSGVVPSELRGREAAELRAELSSRLGSDLSSAEWSQVGRLLASHLDRAARAALGDAGHCRSCGQAVRWVETIAGKRMALNPVEHTYGNVTLVPYGRGLVAYSHGPRDLPITGRPAYRPHVATCPKASVAPAQSPVAVCTVCGDPLHRLLVEDGARVHPLCEPEPPSPRGRPGRSRGRRRARRGRGHLEVVR